MKFALVTLETEESRHHVRDHRDQHKARLAEWMAKQARAGKLIAGEAFETEHAVPVSIRRGGDGAVIVTESPATGSSETLGGYVIVEVARPRLGRGAGQDLGHRRNDRSPPDLDTLLNDPHIRWGRPGRSPAVRLVLRVIWSPRHFAPEPRASAELQAAGARQLQPE